MILEAKSQNLKSSALIGVHIQWISFSSYSCACQTLTSVGQLDYKVKKQKTDSRYSKPNRAKVMLIESNTPMNYLRAQ